MQARIAAEKIYRGEPFFIEVPEAFRDLLRPGCMVLVEQQRGRRLQSTAYILELHPRDGSADPRVELTDLLYGGTPMLDEAMLTLTAWMADYYLCSRGEAIQAALPSAVRASVEEIIEPAAFSLRSDADKVVNTALRRSILTLLREKRRLTLSQLQRRLGKKQLHRTLAELERGGLITTRRQYSTAAPKTRIAWRLAETIAEEAETLLKNAPRQLETFRRIAALGPGGTYAEWPAASRQVLGALEAKGLVEKIRIESHSPFNEQFEPESQQPATPTTQQAQALSALTEAFDEGSFRTFLLHGVTGSGKTLVYIELLKKVLAAGRNAIVLVPEIALTPQTAARFRSHFGDSVAIMHSAMGNQEKYEAWQRLKSGKARIALGARSTIFAPLANLGAIIVDEEHDGAYKQDRSPRYHARDTAVMRARQSGALCVLGSATPSFESYSNALAGKYSLLELPDRIDGAKMPVMRLVLMQESPKASRSISELLRRQIEIRLERDEQVILLQNRRGFSGSVPCHACGHVPTCRHCNIPLVYHAVHKHLRCHYCGHTEHFEERCPACGSEELFYKGSGTERIAEELLELFPDERVLRMDVDTTTTKGAHGRILEQFRNRKARILLGTQMVAKGLDFPDVTLVGVLMADIGLSIPDFRASERIFSLLTQVAGRAGRSKSPGEVYLQVYNPDSDVFRALLRGGYRPFFDEERAMRKALGYPPESRLVKLEWSSPDEAQAQRAAAWFRDRIEEELTPESGNVLGPAPAGIPRLRNRYRFHLLVKLFEGRLSPAFVRDMARQTATRFNAPETAFLVDVDPQSLL